MTFKCKTMRTIGITTSNETTTLKNAINDQVYLKETSDNFDISRRPRFQEKNRWKKLTI